MYRSPLNDINHCNIKWISQSYKFLRLEYITRLFDLPIYWTFVRYQRQTSNTQSANSNTTQNSLQIIHSRFLQPFDDHIN